jgi:hypothetical protein
MARSFSNQRSLSARARYSLAFALGRSLLLWKDLGGRCRWCRFNSGHPHDFNPMIALINISGEG